MNTVINVSDKHLILQVYFNQLISGGMTGVGDICPAGSYCPLGTTTPLPCAAGTFSNRTGLAACLQCPAGYYCLAGEIIISSLLKNNLSLFSF